MLRSLSGFGALLGALACATSVHAAAARDRTAPTAATNLAARTLSAYQVTLTFGPASDNSGAFSYRLAVSDGRELGVVQSATSVRVPRLSPARAYTFALTAVDAAGNRSRAVTISLTTPLDTTPPSAPTLRASYVGSRAVSVALSGAQDDGPTLRTRLYVNGAVALSDVAGATATLDGLAPGTGYAIVARAVDGAGNLSTASTTLAVTTASITVADANAPSTPAGFTAEEEYCGDMFASWKAASDDRDPASALRYDLYADGVLVQSVRGVNYAFFTVDPLGPTRFELVAVDASGNASPPATRTVDVSCE